MSSTKSLGSSTRSICSRNVILGCTAVSSSGADSSSPPESMTPAARPFADLDPLDASVQTDLGAEGTRRRCDRVGDPAHASLGDRPRAEGSVADVTDRMVGHDVAGPRLVRARPGADQPVERHHRLHLLGFEEAIQQVGDRHRHELGEVADRANVQSAEAPRELQLLEQIGGALRTDLRRGAHEQRAEHVGQPADPRLPLLEGVRVALGEFGELVVVA